jgi:hypothetical protein
VHAQGASGSVLAGAVYAQAGVGGVLGGLVRTQGVCGIAGFGAAGARCDGAAFRHAAGGGVCALTGLGYPRFHAARLVFGCRGACKQFVAGAERQRK